MSPGRTRAESRALPPTRAVLSMPDRRTSIRTGAPPREWIPPNVLATLIPLDALGRRARRSRGRAPRYRASHRLHTLDSDSWQLPHSNPLPQPVPVPPVVSDDVLVADSQAEFIPQPLGDVLPNPLISASSGPRPCPWLPPAIPQPPRPGFPAPRACPVSAGRPRLLCCGLRAWPSRTCPSQIFRPPYSTSAYLSCP